MTALNPGRESRVTASFIPALMKGDVAAIYREWQRLVGHPEYTPENLDDVWAVQFGKYIEEFAIGWHERKTGRALTRRQEFVIHPGRAYVSCTLDCFRADDATVIDCKAPGAYRKLDDVLAYYVPQMVVQRGCINAKAAALLVVHGGAEPNEYAVEIPADYEAQVWERVEAFWRCVETLTMPVAMPTVAPPVKAERVYDFTGRNEFASEAAAWLENIIGKKKAETAEKALKAMCPADAAKVQGHGVIITRNKAGALSLREGSAV